MENEYQRVAAFFDASLREIAATDRPPHLRILDLGTGSGRLVGALLAAGYDAYGCDVKPFWQADPPVDVRRLSLISLAPYRLPHDDNSLDAVVSTSVLEHAQNKEEVFREIHRVLKPGGVSLHLFPGKWYLPVEPHLYVPLVNFLWPHCPRWWLAFWARLGVRNEFQHGKPWQEVVQLNMEFCERGLSYWSIPAYRRLSLSVFGNFSTPMDCYIRHGYGGLASALRHAPFPRLWGLVTREVRMNFLLGRKV